MKKRLLKTISVAWAAALCLTGCGSSLPEMTEQQEEAIAEYAAVTLLKYDANNRSRLVDLSTIETEEFSGTGEEGTETSGQEEALASSAETQPAGTVPEAETQGTAETTVPSQAAQADQNTAASMEEFFGLPSGVTITYQGHYTCFTYPDEQEGSAYFMLEASEGNNLLVLQFSILNQTGADADINLFGQDTVYRVTVNNSVARNALMTMLLNDMSTYAATVRAGESVDVVLLVEMDQETLASVTNISLRMRNSETTYTVQLQ